MWLTMLVAPLKRASKLSVAYALYLSIIWLFDYVYYPWLAIKFRHLVILPLYPSIFLASWGGYYLYQYFREDVFFIEKISGWLNQTGSQGITRRIRGMVSNNPSYVFAAISTWWSPLHAYIFFRREETFKRSSLLKALAKGSFFCAVFWGVIAEFFILLWGLVKVIVR